MLNGWQSFVLTLRDGGVFECGPFRTGRVELIEIVDGAGLQSPIAFNINVSVDLV